MSGSQTRRYGNISDSLEKDPFMNEHLLNIREAAAYLEISERAVKELVDAGKLPAYRIGGAFLRFKKSQLIITKSSFKNRNTALSTSSKVIKEAKAPIYYNIASDGEQVDTIKDFLYFNDFYILSVVVVIIAIVLMIAT